MMKLWHVWYIDEDGNEDTLLFCAEDIRVVEQDLNRRKLASQVCDYCLVEADIYSVQGVLDSIKEHFDE